MIVSVLSVVLSTLPVPMLKIPDPICMAMLPVKNLASLPKDMVVVGAGGASCSKELL